MPLRYGCDKPGLEDNWIDIVDVWGGRDKREFMATTSDEEVIAWARRKIESCHIVTLTGSVIEHGSQLTIEAMDDVDLRVQAFIGRSLVEAVGLLGSLGNASARLL